MPLIAVLLLLAIGCGKPADPYGALTGTVTFEGKPAPNVLVIFEDVKTGIGVTTEADDKGRYEARRSVDMPGLPPGEYRVSVTPPMFYPGVGASGQPKAPPQRPDIPTPYRDPATSGLTVTVSGGAVQDFDIAMQP